jgi:hypothetical protein
MSHDVNQPEHQQESTGSGETGAAERNIIFHAYTNPERTRVDLRYFLYPLALLLIIGLGLLTVRLEPEATPFRVETRWGLRTVNKGMTPQEVQSRLGQPTSKERRGNMECYQYGKPTIHEPSFVLHVVCYEDGKLREVSEKRYNSWVVTQDGAISPAPLEYELTPDPAPANPGAPGIANTASP